MDVIKDFREWESSTKNNHPFLFEYFSTKHLWTFSMFISDVGIAIKIWWNKDRFICVVLQTYVQSKNPYARCHIRPCHALVSIWAASLSQCAKSLSSSSLVKTKTSGQLVLCGITLDLMYKLFWESFDYFGKNHEFCILIMVEIFSTAAQYWH